MNHWRKNLNNVNQNDMDITMCNGEGCEVKETCLRHKGKWNEYWQSVFTETPFVMHDDKQVCDHFIQFKPRKDESNN